MRFATLDIGTNSILLLIVERLASGELEVLDDRCRIEGLGRGVDKTGKLDLAAIARGLDAVREYAARIRELRVRHVAAVGTQALREASNGHEFLAQAAEELEVPVEVVAGEREAALSFLAVARSFPELGRGPLLVFDVGGGSTEFIAGHDGKLVKGVSVPIGAVRLAERHLVSDPPTREQAAALFAGIDAALDGVELASGPLVGVAGTVTTLAAVAMGMPADAYEGDRVQGLRLSQQEVGRQVARYLEVSTAERAKIRGVAAKRADVLPAGAAIVERVMARVGAKELIVSDRGLRWGRLFELIDATK